jgi:hypothetical protein
MGPWMSFGMAGQYKKQSETRAGAEKGRVKGASKYRLIKIWEGALCALQNPYDLQLGRRILSPFMDKYQAQQRRVKQLPVSG